MFIKALYLRKDVAGATSVVGILKEAERLEVERIVSQRKVGRGESGCSRPGMVMCGLVYAFMVMFGGEV